jgi:hypothetical protein
MRYKREKEMLPQRRQKIYIGYTSIMCERRNAREKRDIYIK